MISQGSSTLVTSADDIPHPVDCAASVAFSSDTETSSSADIARGYFEAMGRQDLAAAGRYWVDGGTERIVGQADLTAPHGIQEYFGELFRAFPDWRFEVLEMLTEGERTTVRWQVHATFAGPGRFQGFEPNGAQVLMEGCDVVTVRDGRIEHNDAYIDGMGIARQLGLLPPAGSPAETGLARLTNVKTKLQGWRNGGPGEQIADGVWIVRGGLPVRLMNVYLIEDEGGVTVFDAGIEDMVIPIRTAAARLGGIRRVILSHADADHRGAAPGLGAPVYCHPAEREAAESPSSVREYFRFELLGPHGRLLLPRLLPVWDGGPVQIAGTVSEGDEIGGFRVIELPGHAPGLIGLFRERDRLALVSDCFYTVDPQTGRKQPAAIPHPAFNHSTEQAAESIRKLAALNPSAVWAGHTDPITGDVVSQLERAASSAPV
jgi:glyoxylase-like metal-dependent hydrolase (beta-lactamase superfamily II)/predicted ester cyclase